VIFVSGDKAGFVKAQPFLSGFTRAHYYLGEFGNGSKMKFVANLLVAIHNVSTAEAFVLGMKAGLDPKTLFEVMANSAGASRMFQVRGPQMVANDYDTATISVKLFQKDMKIIGDFATQLGVATPLFNTSAMVYNAAMGMGLEKKDTAAVCEVLESMSGVKR
jgi:L-threonate 2-dehydrogenase